MPISFSQKYQFSPNGLLYIAPTGSGKTKASIEATYGQDTSVVGTASLTKNFEQEEKKHFGTKTKRHVTTYAGLARTQELPGGRNLILDEAHYIRNPQTKSFRKLYNERQKYDKALLLTATPIINEPADIASQVDLVANEQVLPLNKKKFYDQYYTESKIDPGTIAKLRGVEPSSIRTLKNPARVRRMLEPYVYVEDAEKTKKLMPQRHDELVKVPMGEKQQEIYNYLQGKLPYSIRYKIKQNLPPSKREAGNLNAYLGGLRQVSNTTSPYVSGDVERENPKIQRVLEDLNDELTHGGKSIIYSNYLDAGVQEIRKSLQSQKVPYSHIIGSMSKPERAKQVDAYNTNKSKVMLITGAGSEGLNLPKTTLVQLTEPHWNIARLYQASSRGIRRGDDPNREVRVKTYLSVFPEKDRKILGFIPAGKTKPQPSVDQYLYNLSKLKEREADVFINNLKEKNAVSIDHILRGLKSGGESMTNILKSMPGVPDVEKSKMLLDNMVYQNKAHKMHTLSQAIAKKLKG